MRSIRLMLFLVFLLSLSGVPLQAATLYVKQDADGTDGMSWETAYLTIGEAIADATGGDSVWIASGTYEESIFIRRAVGVYGGFLGTELGLDDRNPSAGSTILDGTKFETSCVRIRGDAVLDGLSIINWDAHEGGGINAGDCSVEVINCDFSGNKVHSVVTCIGGGPIIGCSPSVSSGNGTNGYFRSSVVTFRGCTFGNRNRPQHGAGIYAYKSDLAFIQCQFVPNAGSTRARECPSIIIDNCNFSDISGNVISSGASSLYIFDSAFVGNRNEAVGSIIYSRGHTLFENCLISNNYSREKLLDLRGPQSGAPYHLKHCTIANNTSGFASLWAPGSKDLNIENSILWNGGNEIEATTATVTNCIVRGWYPGEGNFSEEPHFRDPHNRDYRLTSGSPAIDRAPSVGLSTDIDGNERPFDVTGIGHSGERTYDIGCYEYRMLRSDINQDGEIDEKDLAILQQYWMRQRKR